MREIKFRARFVEDNRWYYLTLKELARLGPAYVNYRDFSQFTGRHDKNGNEVYEGDFLRPSTARQHYNKVGEVRREPGGWQIFTREHWPDWYQDYPMRSLNFDDMQYEVIGNIYEHGHLLNQGSHDKI